MKDPLETRLRRYIWRRSNDLLELIEPYTVDNPKDTQLLYRFYELRALARALLPTYQSPLLPWEEGRPSLDTPIETTFTEVKP